MLNLKEILNAKIYFALINGIISILTQVLLYKFYDAKIVSSLFFVFLIANYVGLVPNINSSLTTENSNKCSYGQLLKSTIIISLLLSSSAAFFLLVEKIPFSLFSIFLFLGFKNVEGILRQGLLVNGIIHYDFTANVILSITKIFSLILLIYIRLDLYYYLYLIAIFQVLYVSYQWLLLKRFNTELNLSFNSGVSFFKLFIKSKSVYINYALYSLIGAVDKFILKNSSDVSFVFLTIITTYLGYLTIFSQQLVQSKMTFFHKLEDIEFTHFRINYFEQLKKIIFLITIFFVFFSPLYLYLFFNISVNFSYSFVIILLALSNYYNLLTQILNNFLYRKGLYDIQMRSTIFAAPIVLLNLFSDLIGALLVCSLVSFFTNIIYFHYSKYKLNGSNILCPNIQ